MSANDELWQDLRERIASLRDTLRDDVEDACPGQHNVTQHRDGRERWCNACRRTSDGVLIE